MPFKDSTLRYRSIYRKFLRLYPKSYRERFADSMEQTFHDLLQERTDTDKPLSGFVLWIFLETSFGILKEYVSHMRLQRGRVIRLSIVVGFLLMIPLVAMHFTDEVDWKPFDFLIAGVLLLGSGFLYEWISGRFQINAYRFAVGITVVSALLLIWINLAVGIIGNEENPANLVFTGVLLIGFLGSILSHFNPAGMSRTLFAMAIAQTLVSAITVLADWGHTFVVNGFFATLWALSALLFRKAHSQQLEPEKRQETSFE